IELAKKVVSNAKSYRYGICGAMETLLVSEDIAQKFLPKIVNEFNEQGVEVRACSQTLSIVSANKATEEDWSTEYLEPIISIKIVKGLDEAIKHINDFGSGHTDSIITENQEKKEKFFKLVDSSSVMHNLPTCYADGFEYGLGAEVGISTDKLHARGPVGLNGLTTQKFILEGRGQIRS
ncbi:MAG: gamma-glutamyl-phosphate reductase, partial [Gammaproteobacteria bacterium]|nr:gamma-glutamyl-phosphate reductase [Gammaproteobacteria bacterium]